MTADPGPPPVLMLCPSYGRPGNIGELADKWAETISPRQLAELLVLLDADDPARPEYPKLEGRHPGCRMSYKVITGPRLGIAVLMNRVLATVMTDRAAIGFMGDDHRTRTPGWDQLVWDHVKDLPAVVYGDDLHQRDKLPTAVVITTSILRPLGYLCPPGQVHLYLDDFWRRLGTDLGCLVYDPRIVIEHLHPHAGKGRWDAGYERVNNVNLYESDRIAYEKFLDTRWATDLARVRLAHQAMFAGRELPGGSFPIADRETPAP